MASLFVISPPDAINHESSILISIPFGEDSETVRSARYSWDSMGRGSEPFVILQYTLAGRGTFRRGGVEHAVGPGQAFISIVPEEARYFYPADASEAWTFCWINFYGRLGVELMARLRERFGSVIAMAPKSDAALRLRRLAAQAEQRKFSTPVEAAAEAYAFCMSLWRQLEEVGPAQSLAGAYAYCQEGFRDPITVKELAARSGMSREHFTRVFSAEHGIAPATLLRRNRLGAAAELLESTSLPLEEVALRTGFYSARHLIKAFRGQSGMSLQAYRIDRGREQGD